MSYSFNPQHGLIIVQSELFGPSGSIVFRLAMGQERSQFPVLVHTLPPSASVDGLLGLDFLREQIVKIDFQQGIISFT